DCVRAPPDLVVAIAEAAEGVGQVPGEGGVGCGQFPVQGDGFLKGPDCVRGPPNPAVAAPKVYQCATQLRGDGGIASGQLPVEGDSLLGALHLTQISHQLLQL